MPERRLDPHAIRRAAASLRPELGRTDQRRLDRLLALLAPDGTVKLDQIDAALEGSPLETFRHAITAAAQAAAIRLSTETDAQTLWFVGEDSAVTAAAALSDAETAGVDRRPQNAIRLERRTVRYFISYTRADGKLPESFLGKLRPLLNASRDFHFEP